MRIPVHSPWLPGYIDVAQTILIILTMAGLFLYLPHVSNLDGGWEAFLETTLKGTLCRHFNRVGADMGCGLQGLGGDWEV